MIIVQRVRSRGVNAQRQDIYVPAQAENKYALPQRFDSIGTLNGLDDVHVNW